MAIEVQLRKIKNPGHESQEDWRQDELVGGKLPGEKVH
jgi:hypothetical protein